MTSQCLDFRVVKMAVFEWAHAHSGRLRKTGYVQRDSSLNFYFDLTLGNYVQWDVLVNWSLASEPWMPSILVTLRLNDTHPKLRIAWLSPLPSRFFHTTNICILSANSSLRWVLLGCEFCFLVHPYSLHLRAIKFSESQLRVQLPSSEAWHTYSNWVTQRNQSFDRLKSLTTILAAALFQQPIETIENS